MARDPDDKRPKPKLVKPGEGPIKAPHGGVQAVAEMMNHLEADHRARLMKSVSERDPKLASKIQEALFTFENVATLSDDQIQKLIKEVPRNLLVLAMRKAPERVEKAIFGNLSTRAAETLREEMGMLGQRPASEVQEAQKKIAEIAKRLAKA